MQIALIIGFVWVEPNSSAAGSRMLQLIAFLQERGYRVVFASPAQKSEKAIGLKELNIEEVGIELNAVSFDVFIKNLNPSLVVFDRFMMEEQFGWRVAQNCPEAVRVLDTEDLHSLRKTRQEVFKTGEQFELKHFLLADITKREVAAILRCDLSLIISSFEMTVLNEYLKIDHHILHHLPFLLDPITDLKSTVWKDFHQRKHFVFVGNFLHAPNTAAVLALKKTIWKQIKEQLPSAELHIYGAYVTQQITQLHSEKEGFLIKGYIHNAVDVVRNARVVLAPLEFGAGIKGKLTEAMQCGTPSVTTNIGAEGMHADLPWSGFIEDDFSKFSEKAIRLYTDADVWSNKQLNGIEIINTLYDKQTLEKAFSNKLNEIQDDLERHRANNFLGRLIQHQSLQASKYMGKWIEEKNKKERS